MLDQNKTKQALSNLVALCARLNPFSISKSQASDFDFISQILKKDDMSDEEQLKLKAIYEKNGIPFSTNHVDMANLVTTIAKADSIRVSDPRQVPDGIDRLIVRSSAIVKFSRGKTSKVIVHAKNAAAAEAISTVFKGSTLIIQSDVNTQTIIVGNNGVTQIISGSNIRVAGGDYIENGKNILSNSDVTVVMSSTSGSLFSTEQDYIEVVFPNLDKVELSGSSTLTYEECQQKSINVAMSGSSHFNISGIVDTLIASVSGSSKLAAKKLISTHASVSASGASSIKTQVAGSLDAQASGASGIKIIGNPEIKRKHSSGVSSIKISSKVI